MAFTFEAVDLERIELVLSMQLSRHARRRCLPPQTDSRYSDTAIGSVCFKRDTRTQHRR
jgi:hypothetical protein